MHLSQLLACALLLTLLSLLPSEAKPGSPKARRAPLGEMPAHAESGALKKRDKTPGGSGASFKGEQSRLLRDLRVDTKSRWTRLLQENPTRKKPNTKKGSSKGCFGQKLDRIGALSGLGC
ncbi:C-type natriuretic peptide [Desmodus rotundus]|uniref:C-type natriuretic peptide n=1 Tax=Desmodus rotundus TaxID=9430 RepID=UPI000D185A5B|nr:C-type natriuretic peptide [Desmodus rotundus]XP_024419737.1 C-type natriuretic peptide [Desmodus rotundus]